MKIEYSKWDGTLHWHFEVEPLGEDMYGKWFGARPGEAIQRGEEPPVPGPGWACLVPHRGSWIAHFLAADDPQVDAFVYINVTDDPRLEWDAVRAIDLDLDVIGFRDRPVILDDEDEFEAHVTRFGYPDSTVVEARATAARLVKAVTRRSEPFGSASEPWIARVLNR